MACTSASLFLSVVCGAVLTGGSSLLEFEHSLAIQTVKVLQCEEQLGRHLLKTIDPRSTEAYVVAARHGDTVARLQACQSLATALQAELRSNSKLAASSEIQLVASNPDVNTVTVLVPGFVSNSRLAPVAAFAFSDDAQWHNVTQSPIVTAGAKIESGTHAMHTTLIARAAGTLADAQQTMQLKQQVADARRQLAKFHEQLILVSSRKSASQVASNRGGNIYDEVQRVANLKRSHQALLRHLKSQRTDFAEALLSENGLNDFTWDKQIPAVDAMSNAVTSGKFSATPSEIETAYTSAKTRIEAAKRALRYAEKSQLRRAAENDTHTQQQHLERHVAVATVEARKHELAVRRAELQLIIAIRNNDNAKSANGASGWLSQLAAIFKMHANADPLVRLAEARTQLDKFRLRQASAQRISGDNKAQADVMSSTRALQKFQQRKHQCRLILEALNETISGQVNISTSSARAVSAR